MKRACSILTLPYLYEALADLHFSNQQYQKSMLFIDTADSYSYAYKYTFPEAYLSIKITKEEVYRFVTSDQIHVDNLTAIASSKEFQSLDSFKISTTLKNLGISYFDLGDIHNAVKYLSKSQSYTCNKSMLADIEFYINLCKIRYNKSNIPELKQSYCNCINSHKIEKCQIIYLMMANFHLDLQEYDNALEVSLLIDSTKMNTNLKFNVFLNRLQIYAHKDLDDSNIKQFLNSEIKGRHGNKSLNHLDYLIQQAENSIIQQRIKMAESYADSAKITSQQLGTTIANKGLNRNIKLQAIYSIIELKRKRFSCEKSLEQLQIFLDLSQNWNYNFQTMHSSTHIQREYALLVSQVINSITPKHISNCPDIGQIIVNLIDFSKSFVLGSKLFLISNNPEIKKLLIQQIQEINNFNGIDSLTNTYFSVSDSIQIELDELMHIKRSGLKNELTNHIHPLTIQIFQSLNQKFSLLNSEDTIFISPLTSSNDPHDLYKQIFPPDMDWSKYDHLTIVPDGEFHNFSFESLLTSDEPYDHPRDAPYLFKKIPISYSLGLHLGRDYSEYEDQGLHSVSFAPEFLDEAPSATRDCEEDRYGQLICNQEEAKLVSTITQGTYFTGENATIENFKESIDKHNFFHLATHACIDTNNYYESSLIFQDGRLPMSELYETDWNNKTVVLSACNTAQGAMVSGEGVFNFARTLTELGCKEVIVSLWPIDDCSTKEFIAIFYQYIQDGLTTAKALQQARITYLEKADKLHADPYFWAPLVLISNDINIGSKPTTQWPYYVGGGILALGLMGWGFKHYPSSRAA